jgi:hypothetical protein
VRSLRIIGYVVCGGLAVGVVGTIVGVATGHGAAGSAGLTTIGTGLVVAALALVGPLSLSSEAMGLGGGYDAPLDSPGGVRMTAILLAAGAILFAVGVLVYGAA